MEKGNPKEQAAAEKKPEATEKSFYINSHYSKGEELFNGLSHAAGVLMGIAVLTLGIIAAAIHQRKALAVLAMIVYGLSMLVLYIASSVYHFMRQGKAKRIVQVMDHCSVYLLIAGTYTPYCWILLGNVAAGWILFGLVWGFSLLGIILNAISMNNKFVRIYSMLSYILLGWCGIFVIRHILATLAAPGIILLFLGGIAYSLGAVFYIISQKKRFFHSIWHVSVIIGTLLHFFSILFFVVMV